MLQNSPRSGGKGGDASSENTLTHMHTCRKETEHSSTQKAAQKDGNFEEAGRPTPRHVGMRKLLNITQIPPSSMGTPVGPTFHGYWWHVGGDCRAMED